MYSRLFRSPIRLCSPFKSSRVFHITDVEGSSVFFRHSIAKSNVVKLDKNNQLQFQKGSGTPYFICGGDVDDRGSHGLSILETLLNFKQRYPDNVFLLVGNREIKNNRLKIELNPDLIRERLLKGESPHWLLNKTFPREYVIKEMEKNGILETSEKAISDYVNHLSIEECQLIYLHWMLDKTLGSPHSFRYRHDELTRMYPHRSVTHHDVLQSFIRETAPNGLMGQYLQHGQVGVLIPETPVLAIHGGLTAENIGRLPSMQSSDPRIENISKWMTQFNRWYRDQVSLWSKTNYTKLTSPGFTDLDASVLPVVGKNPSLIIANMLTKNRNFMPASPVVSEYLQKNNISVVLTGHQPSGDHPAIIRDQTDKVVFINGDTGYANFNPNNSDDTRGLASHSLDIIASQNQVQLFIDATMKEGVRARTDLIIDDHGVNNPFIGKVLADNRLVQCQLPNGNYRLIEQEGHHVKYTVLSKIELEKLIANDRDINVSQANDKIPVRSP